MQGKVTKALIPCGGRGTRMLALTRGGPKELLPVAGIPLLVHVLQECAASGISDALLVISPDKDEIADAVVLSGADGMPQTISIAVQKEPRGLADAIRYGREFAGDSPLAVALPDNLFLGETPALAQVISVYERTGLNAVAIVRVSEEDADEKGATSAYSGEILGDEFRISRIPDKGAKTDTFQTGGAESAYTGVGRYAFDPRVFTVIDDVERTLTGGAELDDIPVMQRLLAQGRLTGCLIQGEFLDVGLPSGYHHAQQVLSSAD